MSLLLWVFREDWYIKCGKMLHEAMQQILLHLMHQALQLSIYVLMKEFDMQMYKKETWICFSCQGICNCERCKKQETGNSDKKPKKRGPQRQKMQGCEESLEHSVSNISPNAPKTDSFQPVMQEQEQNNSYL